MAGAFLEGRIYLTENPPWLSELITLSEGKYTFVNPPLPAVLLVPAVAFFGTNFPQQILAHTLGAGAGALAFSLSLSITKKKSKAIWVFLSLSFGSIFWFLSSVGSAWYLGQVTAVFFILLSMYFSFIKKPNMLIAAAAYSLACLSRTQLFLAAPFFLLLIHNKTNNKLSGITLQAVALVMLAALVLGLYNFLRFNNFIETGYHLIPGILDEPWFQKGIFHPSYVLNHLKILFTGLPVLKPDFPYIFPTWWGLAIWFTSPVFIYTLFNSLKSTIARLSWLSIVAIALVNFSFGSTGFSQFGYRYAVDFYPFLVLLLCLHLKEHKLTKLHWGLLFLSILVNAWGVVGINKMGWIV